MSVKSAIDWLVAGTFSACVGCPSVAFGQTGTTRAAHPVFGEAQAASASASQSADLSVSTEEAYETNVISQIHDLDPTIFRARGFYSALKADAAYAWNGERLKIAATGGSSLRYYPDFNRTLPVNEYAGIGLTAAVMPRTTLSVSQTVAYVPSFLSGLFPALGTPLPGVVATAGTDYSLDTLRSHTYGTTASLNQRLTLRSSVSLESSFRYDDFAATSAFTTLKYYDAGGHWAYRFARTGTLRLGYTFRQGQYFSSLRETEHGLDVGLDLNRPLSRSRRATIRLNAGTTLIDGPAQAALNGSFESKRQYRLVGNGALSYDLGGTWRAQGSYRRGVMFVDGFSGPVVINGLAAEIGGFMSRRLDFLGSAGYSTGEATLVVNGSAFRTTTGDVRLRYALGKMVATYVEYSYYSYTLGRSVLLAPGLFTPSLARNGVHVGLTFWTGLRNK